MLQRDVMPVDSGGTMDTTEANKRLTLAFIDAMNRGDSDAIAGAYAEDGRLCTMGNTAISGTYDKAQIQAFAGGVLEAFPDGLSFEVLGMTAEGERVAVEARSSGTHVSGKPYSNGYHFLFTWRDGKLVELKEYMDTEHARKVLVGE